LPDPTRVSTSPWDNVAVGFEPPNTEVTGRLGTKILHEIKLDGFRVLKCTFFVNLPQGLGMGMVVFDC